MTSYSAWDVASAASRVQDVLGQLPLDSATFASAANDSYNVLFNDAAAQTEAARAQAARDSTAKFVITTDVLAQLNESINANTYLSGAIKNELSRVSQLDKSAKNGIYRTRQEFMLNAYMSEYYKFVTGIMLFTLIVTVVLLSLTALWRMKRIADSIYYALVGIILAIYATSLVITFRRNGQRRNYMWSKYYWQTPNDIRSAALNPNYTGDDQQCPTS